ncbi:putative manganese transporter [Motilibacter aurantiacus]|uniref:putative manganese transporter n=1 Tax=Motilibacter aurantiacus TaxID=2714955 RepID=UPI00140BB762|nr:putative manganese transporter [Motilibacter aurantiacus]NHC46911.1 hypothetical protein [Motilibacter aurantiacus]
MSQRMETLLHDVVLLPLADAFLEVGVFVAVLVVAFGVAQWRYGDRVTGFLQRRRRIAPAVGALLGVIPGCGAEIILATLYARRSVSFGTVVAALVATTGDAAWVLLAGAPAFTLKLHLLTFALGLVTGYAVDALGFSPRSTLRSEERETAYAGVRAGGGAGPVRQPALGTALNEAVSGVSDAMSRALPSVGGAVAVRAVGAVPGAFWMLAAAGFALSVPVSFRLVDTSTLTVDPYLVLGVAGAVLAIAVFVTSRLGLSDDSVESASEQSLRAVLRHGAQESSFIVVWVAAAYIAWEALHAFTGFDGSQLPLYGVAGVLCGALIGFVPGCAVQIVLAGLYLAGGVPVPTLVANAVSQDGDALLPLLATDRRAALWATTITTVPALLAGLGVLLL